jgi:hypothetical protein
MKHLRCLLLLLVWLAAALLFPACAATTVYENGKKVMSTQADAGELVFLSAAGSSLKVIGLNHSNPTMAQGKAASDKIGAIGSAAATAGIMTILK